MTATISTLINLSQVSSQKSGFKVFHKRVMAAVLYLYKHSESNHVVHHILRQEGIRVLSLSCLQHFIAQLLNLVLYFSVSKLTV